MSLINILLRYYPGYEWMNTEFMPQLLEVFDYYQEDESVTELVITPENVIESVTAPIVNSAVSVAETCRPIIKKDAKSVSLEGYPLKNM